MELYNNISKQQIDALDKRNAEKPEKNKPVRAHKAEKKQSVAETVPTDQGNDVQVELSRNGVTASVVGRLAYLVKNMDHTVRKDKVENAKNRIQQGSYNTAEILSIISSKLLQI